MEKCSPEMQEIICKELRKKCRIYDPKIKDIRAIKKNWEADRKEAIYCRIFDLEKRMYEYSKDPEYNVTDPIKRANYIYENAFLYRIKKYLGRNNEWYLSLPFKKFNE